MAGLGCPFAAGGRERRRPLKGLKPVVDSGGLLGSGEPVSQHIRLVRRSIGIVVMALLAGLLGGPAAQASPGWGPWTGTLSISVSERWHDWSKTASTTYSDLTLAGAFDQSEVAANGYRAQVSANIRVVAEYCNELTQGSYTGPSSGMDEAASQGVGYNHDGVVAQFSDASDGTYFAPNDMWLSTVTSAPGCPEKNGHGQTGGFNFYHGFYGGGEWTTAPLVDTDPNPGHLVGTTVWTMADYPNNIAPWSDYVDYRYSVTYDLTRSPLNGTACDDGIDNDGDGRTDFGDDPGCTSAADDSELGSAQCDNGIDDDGNGQTDYRPGSGDAGCESLTDPTELATQCNANASDHHYTTLTAPAELDVAFAPDPHLGTVNMGFHWCMTDVGPKIKTVPEASNPSAYWDNTENWLLLGALESFAGITLQTPDPKIIHGKISSTVTTSLQANLNAFDVVMSRVPVGKLFKPAQKILKKHAKKLNPVAKQLRKYNAKVRSTSTRVNKARIAVTRARKQTEELRSFLNQAQADLANTKVRAERTAIKKRISSLKKSAEAAKRVERVKSIDYQVSLRDLRKIKAEEAKIARKVDSVLQEVRKKLDKVTNFKQQIIRALDQAVDSVHPAWAREVVRKLTDQLIKQVDKVLDSVKREVKQLATSTVSKALRAGSASTGVLDHMKATYEFGLRQLSNIGFPVWDANFTVTLDQTGNAFVADNSASRFIFTVKAKPTVHTS